MRKRRGQILILVLLVVVVALAVGLSVASRNISNLRTSTQTEQSQRAFSAAEGGVEDVLSRLQSIATNPIVTGGGTYTDTVAVGNLQANVSVKSSTTFQRTIELGDVGQIDLEGLAQSNVVRIEWAPKSDVLESANPASLELTVVYLSGGVYSQTRDARSGGGIGAANESTGAGGPWPAPSCGASADFNKCSEMTLANAGARVLRIKPFWNKATVRVTCASGCSVLPPQSYEITSLATTELGVTRKVQINRTAKSQLPSVFDYALYSEEDIIK